MEMTVIVFGAFMMLVLVVVTVLALRWETRRTSERERLATQQASTPPTPSPAAPVTIPVAPAATTLDDPPVHTHPWVYWLGVVAIAALWFIAIVFLAEKRMTIVGISLNFGLVATACAALYAVAGFHIVDRQRLGGIFFLGVPTLGDLTGTPVWVPPGFAWLIEFDLETKEQEFPAEPQFIYRENETVPDEMRRQGYRSPLRITFKEGELDEQRARKGCRAFARSKQTIIQPEQIL